MAVVISSDDGLHMYFISQLDIPSHLVIHSPANLEFLKGHVLKTRTGNESRISTGRA